ncbi:ankyrin repeat domain-containing protein [Novilysobacter arseniciresistens]|uniref:ankyrin repeat domain-containing protein n=1 Tax=Novilysobacter arseniciresistens TaxID=1385522 RepID=UPI001362D114|nr:ankyrin repeat domain-containing protein [Lysobacter arseniciresistens]
MASKNELNKFDQDGNTPLINAVMLHQEEVVEQLLADGADINCPDQMLKMTPLHWAALADNEEIMIMLLNAGADQSINDKLMSTAEEDANANGKRVFAAFRARQQANELDAMTVKASGRWSPSQADADALVPEASADYQAPVQQRSRRL